MLTQQFLAISWREQINFQWDDDEVHFILDQHSSMFTSSAVDCGLESWSGQIKVSMFISSAVDCGLEPWSGQIKDYKINICCISPQ
jgi:hypothetical protein